MTHHPESDYPPLPLSRRKLRRCEVYALAMLYWPLEEVDYAVTIAERESAFDTAAWNNDGEDSRGLWQLNVVPAAHPQLAAWNLWDPQVNAFFAHQLWSTQGWRPWSTAAELHGNTS